MSHSASQTTPPLGPIGDPVDDQDAVTKKHLETKPLRVTTPTVDVSSAVLESPDERYDFTDDGLIITAKDGAGSSIELTDDGSYGGRQLVIDELAGIRFVRGTVQDGFADTDPVFRSGGGG